MDAKTCLEKLKLVGVLSFATVDGQGNPQIRCISAIHFDKDSLYFFTARGKNFCHELLKNGKVQILAYTRFKEMIRLSAKAVPAPESEQEEKINTIFAEQPYLANVYPGGTRKIGIIFEVKHGEVEYFHLGVNPIFRESLEKGGFQKRGISLPIAVLAAENVRKAARRDVSYKEIPIRSSRNTACTAEAATKTAR